MMSFDKMLASELPYSRYLVLELAAVLDRLDAAAESDHRTGPPDSRLLLLMRAISQLELDKSRTDRTESVLRVYSDAESGTKALTR